MLTALCQRWRAGRDSYRLAGECIPTQRYEVALISRDREAKAFVERHHYSRSYPAARLRVGLYRSAELVGVAVLSQPPSQAALDAALPFPEANRAELGRFVLLDDVEANGESWFLARSWQLAKAAGFDAIVAHSDPEARTARRGQAVFPGHVGTIYQATNAAYQGRTPTRTWRLLHDGTVLSARALSKLRLKDRGWRYVVELLVAHGAAATSRTFRHRGNHRYVWALDRALRPQVPSSQRYPKFHIGKTLALQFEDAPSSMEMEK